MNDKDRRLSGRLYSQPHSFGTEGFAGMLRLREINQMPGMTDAETMRQVLGAVGEGTMFVTPFRCNVPGAVTVGEHCFINENCYMMSEGGVEIGSFVDIAPNVCIYTVTHPLRYQERETGTLMYAKKVTVKDHVWLCGNVILNPGVTVGEGSVIGTGSVVTHDIPAGVFAAGNPCRVIRPLTEADSEAFLADLAEYRADPDTRHDEPWPGIPK